MRGDIADHAGKLLFQIRAAVTQQCLELQRYFRIARKVDRTVANRCFAVRTAELHERQQRTGNGGIRLVAILVCQEDLTRPDDDVHRKRRVFDANREHPVLELVT